MKIKIDNSKPLKPIYLVILGVFILFVAIFIGKMAYNHYTLSSDERLKTALVEKISEAEKVSKKDISVVKIDGKAVEKKLHVTIYYKVKNQRQKSKTFHVERPVFGDSIVKREIK